MEIPVVDNIDNSANAAPDTLRDGATPLLSVQDLKVSFRTSDGVVQAVRGVSFDVERGKTLAIVGESGSGKSVSTQTVVGLTRGAMVSGRALFEGRDLLTMSKEDLRQVRGAKIGMIFQDSQSSLHPYYRVGWQISEMIRAHDRSISKSAARERSIELLRRVGIPKPERRVDDFPHQFSGGMRQRAMIAMAMALDPVLLVADEPTTALDVTVQAQVLEVMADLQAEFGTALIMITHDLGVVADVADEVAVMYAGRIMERTGRRELFYHHHHPYTEGLLGSLPAESGERQRLRPISGAPPSLIRPPSGCPFHPRCPYAFDQCRSETPPLREVFGDQAHHSACWLPTDEAGRGEARAALTSSTTSTR
ncbi:ABC transporter ATP-binding protein [Actinopolymorpha rutila]|uniref:Oligopeptide/dipeptide ABC transporter ATP-binding protein n=1 Tax=Actinopolymorpha rutila TaxID=446787 RepID=A0A852ZPH6_9ACTN|nr:ABC transporter ATP-binding protein [Actinopolymorpha rutila]NYH90426.1 oligopeptide/dipeptide ABC transporter ATP-binding protein [Actinopolymorpha rutila]